MCLCNTWAELAAMSASCTMALAAALTASAAASAPGLPATYEYTRQDQASRTYLHNELWQQASHVVHTLNFVGKLLLISEMSDALCLSVCLSTISPKWYTAATAALAALAADAAAAAAGVTLLSGAALKLEKDCTVRFRGAGASCSRLRATCRGRKCGCSWDCGDAAAPAA